MDFALIKGLVNNPDTIYDNKLARVMAFYAHWKYKDTEKQALKGEALIAC